MAAYYGDGYRPVLKGRNYFEFKNPITGIFNPYGDRSLWGTSHIFDDAPLIDHQPGTGYSPHGFQYSQWFLGLAFQHTPMDFTGKPDRPLAPFFPYQYYGLEGIAPLRGAYGHTGVIESESSRVGYVYRGLPIDRELNDPGHVQFEIGDPRAPATFGSFHPLNPGSRHVGIAIFASTFGEPVPVTVGDYGHDRVQEWEGVPSAVAL